MYALSDSEKHTRDGMPRCMEMPGGRARFVVFSVHTQHKNAYTPIRLTRSLVTQIRGCAGFLNEAR